MPEWKPAMINDAFGQDDLYVEMTFLRTLEQYGLDVSIRQAGIDFANSGYPLWCANNAGRNNLRDGIAPPDSSHPQVQPLPERHRLPDRGRLLGPDRARACRNVAIELGEKFGRLMNYGDGMYAGQFMGGDVRRGVLRERPGEDRRGRAAGAFPPRASTPRWSATCSPGTARTRTTGRRPGS